LIRKKLAQVAAELERWLPVSLSTSYEPTASGSAPKAHLKI
jgi:hypothetical protein